MRIMSGVFTDLSRGSIRPKQSFDRGVTECFSHESCCDGPSWEGRMLDWHCRQNECLNCCDNLRYQPAHFQHVVPREGHNGGGYERAYGDEDQPPTPQVEPIQQPCRIGPEGSDGQTHKNAGQACEPPEKGADALLTQHKDRISMEMTDLIIIGGLCLFAYLYPWHRRERDPCRNRRGASDQARVCPEIPAPPHRHARRAR